MHRTHDKFQGLRKELNKSTSRSPVGDFAPKKKACGFGGKEESWFRNARWQTNSSTN